MKKISQILATLFVVGLMAACGSAQDIFPPVPLSSSDADFELPNPIALATDVARGQLIVANSNIDFIFDHGSLGILAVDASNPDSVTLTVSTLIEIPNFAGEMVFDGTLATIPFRDEAAADSSLDQIIQYTVGAGTLTQSAAGTVSKDPFGMIANGSDFLVVSDDVLSFVAANLSISATVDLKAADTAGITEATAKSAETAAIDPATNRAFVTNRNGKMFVIDLATQTMTHVLSGATNTRGILADSGLLYVVDGNPAQLRVLDPSRLAAATTLTEASLDSLAVAQIALGTNPNSLVMDAADNRLFVANTSDPSISVIDTTLYSEIARLSLAKEETGLAKDGKDPFAMVVGTYSGVNLLFVANLESNTIFIYNARTLKLVGSFP